MDLDEMLCVDRCRDMDKLINFCNRSKLVWNAGTGLLSLISYALQHRILLRRENPMYRYWVLVVLKWFHSLRAVGTTL